MFKQYLTNSFSLPRLDDGFNIEHITSLFKESETSSNDLCFVVQDAILYILQAKFSIHYLLVGLRVNCNQTVKKNEENKNLIQNPDEVYGLYHEIGYAALEICVFIYRMLEKN
jgi:hypothetical protein